MEKGNFILQIKGISKTFLGVKALNKVRFDIKRGVVHALMGENGAGKSTLMKILIGIYHPDEGDIIFKGKNVHIHTPHQALRLGISMIHQELNPVLEMTVSDNIFLGREPVNLFGCVNDRQLQEKTIALFETLGIKGISPKAKMKNLSIAQIQMVEIVKAVSYQADLIIMDEPTSAISVAEVVTLFKIIGSLREKGIAVIYISHKMDEIFRIADEITVLRDGEYIGTEDAANMTREKLISMMVGRELKDFFHKEKSKVGEVVLELRNLNRKGFFEDINLKLHRGEILGIAGLMGSGRTEIVESVFGMYKLDSGEIYKDGKKITISKTRDAIKQRIVLATEDRKALGLFLPLSVRYNISISWLKNFCKLTLVRRNIERDRCEELIDALKIKTPSIERKINTLSGGNQQKVVLARWLLTVPDILILDEPTRGIDIGAKAEIYNIMVDLVKQGKSIIMISSEMPELLGMCDRIVVVRNGRITGELDRHLATQEKIMELASL